MSPPTDAVTSAFKFEHQPCLYSFASMLLRNLSAVSQSLASKRIVASDEQKRIWIYHEP